MLFFFFSLFLAYADNPDMCIVVSDSKHDEIYMESPSILCDTSCIFDVDENLIFTEANRKHRTWYTKGKIGAVFNEETVRVAYPECDFKKRTFACAQETGMWVLRTTIIQNNENASISLILFDENAIVIGQATVSKNKKVQIVQRQKKTVSQGPNQPMSISTQNCNQSLNNCQGNSFSGYQQGPGQTVVEDLEPTVIEIPPVLTTRDLGQAMSILYDSIR
tara:strand:- start:123 stop:782 length:660 start_codon:yes stop_codon:yes gene_type:complete